MLQEVLEAETGGLRAPNAVLAVAESDGPVRVFAENATSTEMFGIGSVTKIMTATMVMQHVARGHITLDDPVAKYVPSLVVDPPDATGEITIRQLLTHTSGLDCADDFTDTGDGADCVGRFVDNAISGSKLLHYPGEFWSYSNCGYTLLGRMIELLDGTSWDQALTNRIIQPLGLRAKVVKDLRNTDVVATGHRLDKETGSLVTEQEYLPSSSGPAGSTLLATAEDLVTFARALFSNDGELVDPLLAAEMIRPVVSADMFKQGIGWWVLGTDSVAHSGSNKGTTAHLQIGPAGRTIAVVAGGPGAHLIADSVIEHMDGNRSVAPGETVHQEVAEVDCVGRYRRRHVEHSVSMSGARLVAETSYAGPISKLFADPEPVELVRTGGAVFTDQRASEIAADRWVFRASRDGGPASHLLTGSRMHVRCNARD